MNFIIMVAIASLLIGLSKGGLGGPMPIALITPILSQVMTAPHAVGVTLPLLLFGDVLALRKYWRKWNMEQVKLLLPMGVAGVIVGTLLLAFLTTRPDDTLFRRILGLIALLAVVFKLLSDRSNLLHYKPQTWHGHLAGAVAGFGSALANSGAPPFTAYMLLQRVSPQMFIGTATLFFAIVNALKIPGVLLTGALDFQQLWSILWAVPLIPAGVWLGHWFIRRVDGRVFEWMMIVLLIWMSATLLLTAPK